MATAQDVLSRARRDLGYAETGNNHNKFSASWGKPDEPWCADAVTRWLSDAGALDVPQSSYTPTLYQEYVNAGRAGHAPRLGAVVFFQWAGEPRICHVGLVEGFRDPGHIVTIEGNTAGPGGSQANGGEVWRKVRSLSLVAGFGYPQYASAQPSPSPRPTLNQGDRGQAVLNVQLALNRCGNHLALDGVFGPQMLAIVKVFQQHRGLSADGVVGPATWNLLGKVMGH